MRFEKGKPKTGGRQKGTPNRATRFAQWIEDNNIDLFAEAFRCYEALIEPRDRMHAILKLMEFAIPKPKEIEAAPTEVKEAIQVTPENLPELYEIARTA
jgi:hypothetical protein